MDDVKYVMRGCLFFFQAEDGIRDLVRSRGLGDVYKRQGPRRIPEASCRETPKRESASSIAPGSSKLNVVERLSLIHI